MINPVAALIAPLAGLALIAAASAVSVNPLLLQLVTISSNRRRRRRRQLEQSPARRAVRQIQVLENFLSSSRDSQLQSDLLMVNYLQCGDLLAQTNHCLELMVCTYSSSSTGRPAFSKQQRDVVSM